jgi:Uma2 family endonuclease
MSIQYARRRFTVSEYHAMGEAGIIGPDERVELIDGEIIPMSPINEPHASEVDRLTDYFVPLFRDRALIRVQGPTIVDDYSEPEPDLLVLRRAPDFYRSGHPRPADILLVIEVSDTSTSFDRRVKAPLYARTNVIEHWRVELRRSRIVVHRDPTPEGYRTIRIAGRGETIAPLAFPDRPIPVDDILG